MNHSSSAPLSFSSADSLSSFLKPLVPLSSSWGSIPGSKTVHNLFLELSRQETLLLLDPSLLRAVNVATLTISNPRRPSSVLLESHQLMSDGSVRRRMRPLSEKMTPGESVEAAAERAVREELGPDVRVRVDMGTYEVRVEEKGSSVSYPGLPARYMLHSVKAVVEGVPEEGEFSTEEGGEGHDEDDHDGTVSVKRHFWKWVEDYDSSAGASGASGS